MKKIIAIISILVVLASNSVHAAETWKGLFTTRLMKLMTAHPTYTDIVLTDLDKNGIPEAFLLKKGMSGDIHTGITFKDSAIVNIEVPKNVTGACLEDITVYDAYGTNVYVGKEIGRYTAEILYYELKLEDNKLTCKNVEKSDYCNYAALPFKDFYGNDFYDGNFPDRAKIEAFMETYDMPTHINVKESTSSVSVNGNTVDIAGVMVSENNYYKIRDIAMLVRTTSSRFEVGWDQNLNAITITTGVKYSPIGSELTDDTSTTLNISKTIAPIYVDGEKVNIETYTINDSTYIKIRDLGDLVGFSVGWDGETQTVLISTN